MKHIPQSTYHIKRSKPDYNTIECYHAINKYLFYSTAYTYAHYTYTSEMIQTSKTINNDNKYLWLFSLFYSFNSNYGRLVIS